MTELYSESVERSILGAILLDNELFFEAEQEIRAADFALDSHRLIYQRIADAIRSGNAIDPVILIGNLGPALQSVGGAAYVSDLTSGIIRRPPLKRYLGVLREKSLLRSLRGLGESITAGAEDAGADADRLMGDAESRLLELRAGASSEGDTLLAHAVVPFLDRFEREHERTGDLLGLPIGIASIDTATRGFQEGEITQLARAPAWANRRS